MLPKNRTNKKLIKDDSNELKRIGNRATKICAYKAEYLKREIEALKPKLIVAVGGKAVEALLKYSKDERLYGRIEELVFEKRGIFNNVKIGRVTTDIVVVPHPSGLNTTWVRLAKDHPNAKCILEKISSKIIETMKT